MTQTRYIYSIAALMASSSSRAAGFGYCETLSAGSLQSLVLPETNNFLELSRLRDALLFLSTLRGDLLPAGDLSRVSKIFSKPATPYVHSIEPILGVLQCTS